MLSDMFYFETNWQAVTFYKMDANVRPEVHHRVKKSLLRTHQCIENFCCCIVAVVQLL